MRRQGTEVDRGLAGLPARIRGLRRERAWTLERLASETALSKAYLGRLENGQRQPSLAALLALARAFGLSVAQLVEASESAAEVIVRRAESTTVRGDGLHYQPLSPANSRGLQAMHVVVPAARSRGPMYEHPGEEWLYVLSGRLRLALGDTETELETGDAAQFDGRVPHRLAAVGGQDVHVLLVAGHVARPVFDPPLAAPR